MQNFSTGAVRDDQDDKESYPESVSFLTLRRYARYMLKQSKKYGTGNWKKGIPTESYEDSLMRHLMKYFIHKQYNVQIEPDVDHLAAALFNLQGIIHNEEVQNSLGEGLRSLGKIKTVNLDGHTGEPIIYDNSR